MCDLDTRDELLKIDVLDALKHTFRIRGREVKGTDIESLMYHLRGYRGLSYTTSGRCWPIREVHTVADVCKAIGLELELVQQQSLFRWIAYTME